MHATDHPPTLAPQPPIPAHRPTVIPLNRPRRGPWLQLLTPAGFEWNTAEIPIESLPPALEGFRIVHLSDLHLRAQWWHAYDELIDRLRADPPNLLLNTGDYVDNKRDHRPALPFLQRLLTQLPSRLGQFGVIGNHDGDLLAPRISGWNIRLIGSRRVTLDVGDAKIDLIGLAGADRDDFDAEFLRNVGPKPDNSLRIVLSHYPDAIVQTRGLNADLFLAGHTHGGQVCLPGEISLLRHDSLPRNIFTAIHRLHGTWLVANRGFGFSNIPIRAFCPAEVIELKLVRAAVGSFR